MRVRNRRVDPEGWLWSARRSDRHELRAARPAILQCLARRRRIACADFGVVGRTASSDSSVVEKRRIHRPNSGCCEREMGHRSNVPASLPRRLGPASLCAFRRVLHLLVWKAEGTAIFGDNNRIGNPGVNAGCFWRCMTKPSLKRQLAHPGLPHLCCMCMAQGMWGHPWFTYVRTIARPRKKLG